MADGKVVIDVILDDGTVAKGVANIDRRLGVVAKTGRRVATGIKEIVTALGIASAASKAIDMINRSLDGAIDRYDTLKNFPRVMQLIGFDAAESEKAIQRLSEGVQGLPTRLDHVAKTAQQIAILTGDLEGAVETTLALNNAFLASGASTMDAERGLVQYIQMLAKGKVDAQSWITLQETMGVALNKTAEAFGFTGASAQNDLYEALKDGLITFDEFNAKIIELSKQTGGFADMAQVSSAGIKTAITNLRTWIVKGVADVIEAIDMALGGTGSIEGAINSLKPLVFGFFGWVAEMVLKIAEGFRTVIDALDPWIPSFEGIKEVVSSFFEYITSFWRNNGQEILQNATAIFEGIRGTIQTAFDAVYQVVSDVLGSKVMPFIQEQLAKIQQFWQENGTQIMIAVENAFKFIQSVIEAVMPAVKFIIEIVWTAIQDIISGALNVILGLVKVFTGIFTGDFSKMWEGIKNIFRGAIDLIIGWLSLSFFGGVRKIFTDLLKTGVNIIRNMWTSIVNFFKTFTDDAVAKVSSMRTRVWDYVKRLATNFIQTISNLKNDVIKRFQEIKDEIINKVKSIDLVQIGKDIIQGLINGIGSMISKVKEKVEEIASSLPEWMKKILGIASPSKVTTKIGEEVTRGLAVGISKKQKEAEKAAKKAAQAAAKRFNEAFKSASHQFKMGKINATQYIQSLENIRKNYAKTADHIRKIDLEILKTQQKHAKDSFNTSKNYIEKLRRENKITLEQELELWLRVQDRYKAGTKERIEAEKQVYRVRQELAKAQFEASRQWIERQKKYNNLSLMEELRAWERVQERYKIGSKERQEAEEEIYRVKKEIHDRLTALNEEYFNKMQEIMKKEAEEIQKLNEAYEKAVEDRAKSIYSFANLFDEVTITIEQTGEQLLNNLAMQVSALRSWEQQITNLVRRGIDEGLLAELREMGPKALPQLIALNELTDEQLAQYSELYREKTALARQLAESELVGLKEDTEKQIKEIQKKTEDQLSELQQEWATKIRQIRSGTKNEFNVMKADMRAIGEDSMRGMIAGLESMRGRLIETARSIVEEVQRTLRSALEIKSPSRWMRDVIGKNMVLGWVEGIERERNLILRKTEQMAQWMKPDIPVVNRLRGVTAPIGNVTPISSTIGAVSSITNNYARSYNPTFNNYFTREESTPSEVARKNKQQSQLLAMEWGLT